MPVILKLVTGGTIRRLESKKKNRGVILHDLDGVGATEYVEDLRELPGIDGLSREAIKRRYGPEKPFVAVGRDAFDEYVERAIHPNEHGFAALLQRVKSTQTAVERQTDINPEIDGAFVRVVNPGKDRDGAMMRVAEYNGDTWSAALNRLIDRVVSWF